MTDVTTQPPLVAALPAAVDGVVDPDAVYEAFAAWAAEGGRPLPAQDEAVIELVSGANVVLSTPTGTGKSLVAAGRTSRRSPRGSGATTRRRSRPSSPRSSSSSSTCSARRTSAW